MDLRRGRDRACEMAAAQDRTVAAYHMEEILLKDDFGCVFPQRAHELALRLASGIPECRRCFPPLDECDEGEEP
jgi:hypothetical protein